MKELITITPRPRIVTICTGAGTMLPRLLWETPGASEYLVGCYFPYSKEETDEALGFAPSKYVSEETAIHLAIEAYMRASLRSALGDNPIGIGLTASVASLRMHRAPHQICLAAMSDTNGLVASIQLDRAIGSEARRLDDETCSGLAAAMLLDVAGRRTGNGAEPFRRDFLSRPFFGTGPGERRRETPHDGALFPGTFDPITWGHESIAELVSRRLQMARRAATLRAKGYTVLFSDDDPLYIDKARRFPGRTLVIGADALLRMLDRAWGPDVEPMLGEFEALGTRFHVVPRLVDGRLVELADIDCRRFAHLFTEVEIDAPFNVSSTEMRAKENA